MDTSKCSMKCAFIKKKSRFMMFITLGSPTFGLNNGGSRCGFGWRGRGGRRGHRGLEGRISVGRLEGEAEAIELAVHHQTLMIIVKLSGKRRNHPH